MSPKRPLSGEQKDYYAKKYVEISMQKEALGDTQSQQGLLPADAQKAYDKVVGLSNLQSDIAKIMVPTVRELRAEKFVPIPYKIDSDEFREFLKSRCLTHAMLKRDSKGNYWAPAMGQ